MTKIEVVTRPYRGTIWRDEDVAEGKEPPKIQLDERTLAQQLDLDIAELRSYMRAKKLHIASKAESALGAGLCSEELVGISVCHLLVDEFRIKVLKAKKVSGNVTGYLLKETFPVRTWLIVVRSNRGTLLYVMTKTDKPEICKTIALPEASLADRLDLMKSTRVFDATQLRDAYEQALLEEPLRFPKARACEVVVLT